MSFNINGSDQKLHPCTTTLKHLQTRNERLLSVVQARSTLIKNSVTNPALLFLGQMLGAGLVISVTNFPAKKQLLLGFGAGTIAAYFKYRKDFWFTPADVRAANGNKTTSEELDQHLVAHDIPPCYGSTCQPDPVHHRLELQYPRETFQHQMTNIQKLQDNLDTQSKILSFLGRGRPSSTLEKKSYFIDSK